VAAGATQAVQAAALQVVGASKTYLSPEGRHVRALDGVSLTVAPGEFFVLLGPSGCGKTTLLRSIAGLEQLDEGEIRLGDRRLDELPPNRRPVNTVFQSYALFPHLTAAQNIAFGLEAEGRPKAEIATRVAEALALVRMPDHGRRRPAQLSGGQQQRIALARALAKEPAVLLLDEPLAALDLKLRRGMQAELTTLQRRTGITFVFVTHDQEEAMALGDRIAVFDSGRLVQVGTPEEVYDRPVDRFVADFIGETTFVEADAVADGGALAVRLPGGTTRVALPPDGPQLAAGPVTLAVRPERVRLLPPDADPPQAAAVTTGVVREVTYMGADLRSTVLIGTGGTAVELAVRTPALLPTDHIRPGLTVLVAVAPEHLRPVAQARTAVEEALVDEPAPAGAP
jgi:spermidine/putrescine transport system ATP-binding protein